jgi:hypothetical protein
VLTSRELEPAADGFELVKRRNITIRPKQGAHAVLRERIRTPSAVAS